MVVYNYDNIRKFLERQLPYLMTNLVLLSSQRDVGAALDFISNQVEKKPKKLLADHFPTIFTKIVTQVRTCRKRLKKCAPLQRHRNEIESMRTKIVCQGLTFAWRIFGPIV